MEAKTLKDIELDEHNQYLNIQDQIKKEAIKWVKRLENESIYEGGGFDFETNYNVIEWIRMFFNITNEDLEED